MIKLVRVVGNWYNSVEVEETLAALGLPPNHKKGEPCFLTRTTTEKRGLAEVASDSHPNSRRSSRCAKGADIHYLV